MRELRLIELRHRLAHLGAHRRARQLPVCAEKQPRALAHTRQRRETQDLVARRAQHGRHRPRLGALQPLQLLQRGGAQTVARSGVAEPGHQPNGREQQRKHRRQELRLRTQGSKEDHRGRAPVRTAERFGSLVTPLIRARFSDCSDAAAASVRTEYKNYRCNTRRMVETAAHLAEHVIPRLPVRQWVLSVPKRLRCSCESAGTIGRWRSLPLGSLTARAPGPSNSPDSNPAIGSLLVSDSVQADPLSLGLETTDVDLTV